MKQTIIGLALCAVLAWGVWQQRPEPVQNDVVHRELFALGTLIQISVAGHIEPAVMNQAQAALTDLETRWSVLGDGDLAQLNKTLQTQTSAPLPSTLQAGFAAARQLCLDSGGRFDPGVGDLVRLWGFDDEDHFRTTPPPVDQLNAALQQRSSLCDSHIDPQTVVVDQVPARFDFGASAKGRAVDEVIALLQAAGIHNAIINAGGDIKVIGRRAQRAWRIGIRHPRPVDGRTMLASLEVHDGEAIFTSGDYERFFIDNGVRYHHILDPRTGLPAMGSQSATVLHSSAERADAAATALFVAGAQDAASVMQQMGVDNWLLIDANGRLHASDAMRARIPDLASQ